MKVLLMAKVLISSEQIKILYSVYKLLSVRNNRISREDILRDSGINKRVLSRLIQNRYLLKSLKSEVQKNA